MILIYTGWVGECVRVHVRVEPKNMKEIIKIYFRQFIVRSYDK